MAMNGDKPRLCEGKNRKGGSCRMEALPGNHFCVYHNPDVPPAERMPPNRWSRHSAALKDLHAAGMHRDQPHAWCKECKDEA